MPIYQKLEPASDGVARVCQWVDITHQIWRDCGKLQVSGINLLVLYNVSSWNIVHGNSVQPSRISFFCALPVNVVQLCCSLFSQWVKRGQSVRGPHRLRQLGGWNRSVGNWKRVCVVCDRNGVNRPAKDGF
jgi:hypothetical protein